HRSHLDLYSFPTRRSSDLDRPADLAQRRDLRRLSGELVPRVALPGRRGARNLGARRGRHRFPPVGTFGSSAREEGMREAASMSWRATEGRRFIATAPAISRSATITMTARTPDPSGAMATGATRRLTRFITLISGLRAGPAVSLRGSPTVSPITPAL